MITIIHGTDIVASRKYFLDEKQRHPETSLLDGEKITLTDLAQIFGGSGLFEETKTVFIENFFIKKKNKTEFKILSEYLQKQKNHEVFLWENKELDKTSLITFKNANVKIFKLPQTLFLLLDSLKPGNDKQLISLFHQTLITTEVEMIFFMIIRQIRSLLTCLPGTHQVWNSLTPKESEQIDEIKRLAPWQKSKLQQQASLFTPEQLLHTYKKLFDLELAQKTGNLSSSLIASIDFLLLEI